MRELIFWLIGIMMCSIFFVPMILKINIFKDEKTAKVDFEILIIFKIYEYKIDIPRIDLKVEDSKMPYLKLKTKEEKGGYDKKWITIEELIDLKEKFYKYYNIIEYIKNKMFLKYCKWQTEIGTEMASETAIVTGFIWMLKSNVDIFIRNNIKSKDIIINVMPNYRKKEFKSELNCIISIKIGYIIITAIKFGYIFLRKRW
ncbi:DUF2953 domain-containing protein [Lutibacter sp. B2]|nr:DUF2953 domain-containing protein [Lutibacter sp. B2]